MGPRPENGKRSLRDTKSQKKKKKVYSSEGNLGHKKSTSRDLLAISQDSLCLAIDLPRPKSEKETEYRKASHAKGCPPRQTNAGPQGQANKKNQGSLEKWLIPGLGQNKPR